MEYEWFGKWKEDEKTEQHCMHLTTLYAFDNTYQKKELSLNCSFWELGAFFYYRHRYNSIWILFARAFRLMLILSHSFVFIECFLDSPFFVYLKKFKIPLWFLFFSWSVCSVQMADATIDHNYFCSYVNAFEITCSLRINS